MPTPSDTLCPGCFEVPRSAGRCPQCGFDAKAARPHTALPPGTVLQGQYVLGRLLGKPGGFGLTYLAYDRHLDTRVAIKEFLPRELAARGTDQLTVLPHGPEEKTSYRYGLEQFLAEARTLAKLDHPNIARVRTYFEANGSAYLVMDYYRGGTLEETLAEQPKGRLSEDQALALIQPILDGLAAVHAHGILHRDIKPANIYLARTDSGGLRPILLDFGAARQAMGERSRSLSVILTPGYAPFEQYHSKGHQGPWSDVYAAAAVLYRMLTGETPPEANARMDQDDLRPASAFGISDALSKALDKALALRVSERTQDVAAFRHGLRGRAKHKQPQPRWKFVIVGAGVVIVIAGLIVAASHNSQPTRQQDGAAFTRAKSLGTKDGYRAYLKACQDWGCAHQAEALAALEQLDSAPDQSQPAQAQPEQREQRTAETLQPGDVFRDPLRDGGEGPEMVVIPAGSFTMGSNQGSDDEKPRHGVTISQPFALGRTEVTFAEWDACVADGGCQHEPKDYGWGRDERPVINVSWDDAQDYLRWLSGQTGQTYRLPSEAEWEYAARARTTTAFSTGPCITTSQANYDGNHDYNDCGAKTGVYLGKTQPVGSYPSNPWGLDDMHGNVFEWNQDCWNDSYRGAPSNGAAWTSGDCDRRVLRGGAWNYDPRFLRAANRGRYAAGNRVGNGGFRLARTLSTAELPKQDRQSKAEPNRQAPVDPQPANTDQQTTAAPPWPAQRAAYEPEMIGIPGGCFQMGSPPNEEGRHDDAERQHQVCLEPFYLAAHEVTQAQWQAVMGDNPSYVPGCNDCPVENVSWHAAREYINMLNTMTGRNYRLPTEAEWEYAARAGTTTSRYWGDNPDQACRYENIYDKTGDQILNNGNDYHRCDDGFSGTAPVGSFLPNAWGLYDTLGNVVEWTCSAWQENYGDAENKCSNHNGSFAARGGHHAFGPDTARSAQRINVHSDYQYRGILGLRLAADVAPRTPD